MDIGKITTKLSAIVLAAIFFLIPSIFCGCTANTTFEGELIRLHIRANSDAKADQDVKLKVRDAVNEYLCDFVTASTFDEAYVDIVKRLPCITSVCKATLKENGFSYGAKAKMTYEYFPTRQYGETVVPEGYYNALIVELGEALGNNWWCVVYPPLCYGTGTEYKSFFAELFA